ncbi:nuclear transport factor 2 family protein [Gloeocapsopsis crepidinum LEGE 06123]|uniref:Nuclear transport factor 2 family protein n=1 Tax=Gloeocapsopsis crepidinum LEGE 06123 TaxID=588587 RepID=A0ABR9UZ14_9CHRO|nr:nuclear transport factor 2 family protein [Gloeocapsopsis crepidinum]MBE9193559.1 nuclear transport factor 2 family protein [Gloeocapsopsis crepidinum LEGE 06123]
MTDSADKAAILAVNEAFYRAFSHRDIGSMSLLWWQGSTSLCIHPGGKVLIGWETIQASWESIFRNTELLEIDIEIIKVEIDQAIAYVVVQEIVLQSSRGRKVKAPSIATNIFQRMAQKWYLIHHHGSPIVR